MKSCSLGLIFLFVLIFKLYYITYILRYIYSDKDTQTFCNIFRQTLARKDVSWVSFIEMFVYLTFVRQSNPCFLINSCEQNSGFECFKIFTRKKLKIIEKNYKSLKKFNKHKQPRHKLHFFYIFSVIIDYFCY